LSKNINFTQINKSGFNVFHVVSENENTGVLKMLVEEFKGKNLKEYLEAKTSDNHFQTPLHKAAIKGSTAIAEYLISHLHVNKEVLDYKNRTPLALAARYSNKFLNYFII
jgi:ankyrin repeat protein